MNITPEMLKVIAQGMGYCVNESFEDGVTIDSCRHWIDYNPDTTNDTQCMEIMEKLKIDIKWFGVNCVTFDKHGDMLGEGRTINESVCAAAYEHFKGE